MLLPSTTMIQHCGSVLAGSDSGMHTLHVLSFGSRITPLSVHSHTAIVPQSSMTWLDDWLYLDNLLKPHVTHNKCAPANTEIFVLSSDILFLQSSFSSGALLPPPLSLRLCQFLQQMFTQVMFSAQTRWLKPMISRLWHPFSNFYSPPDSRPPFQGLAATRELQAS